MLAKTHVNLSFTAAVMSKIPVPNISTAAAVLIFNFAPAAVRYVLLTVAVVLCAVYPSQFEMLFIPLAVMIGSLLPDLDHPNSTLSRVIAPTGIAVRAMLAAAGVAVIWYGRPVSQWLVAAGVLLAAAAALNIKLLPLEKCRKILLVAIGAALIITNQHKLLVALGVLYIMMGVLTHRGLTHSTEGALLAIACAWWFTRGTAYSYLLLPFAVGYISHLLADLITDSGIWLTYFGQIKQSLPLITTGSSGDKFLGTAGLIFVIASLA